MLYPPVALERAMTIREVVLRAMSGEITWIQAAECQRQSKFPQAR